MSEFEKLTAEFAGLIKRLEPWSGAVSSPQLPGTQFRQIRELAAVVRSRSKSVAATPETRSTVALFTGPGGTCKTMAGQLIAHELDTAVLRVDLGQVVSKYIGETEKNLTALFSWAQTNGAILFFDEADALFGKRSEVKDSNDRYANVEAALLLEQAQAFPGLVIFACEKPLGLLESTEHVVDISASAYPCD